MPVYRSSKGFTLIEILLAVLILSFMSAMTAFSIQRSIKLKAKLEKEIDDDSQLREVVALITKDLNLAFHWYDPQEVIKKKLIDEAKSANRPDPFPTPQQAGVIIPAEKLTYFMGERDSMSFTSLNHGRTVRDSQESDQVKITYSLKTTRSFKDQKNTQSLVRSIGTFLDGDYKRTGKDSVLIENVKEFRLRYLPDLDVPEISDASWFSNWKSMEGDDIKMNGKFPNAVELTLVIDRDGRVSQISTLIAIHNPNNEPFKFVQPPSTAGGLPR